MQQGELIPGLFRSEFSKICAVLTRYMGMDYIQVAEDIASETFVTALETWTYNGIPENPVAWLYVVAKNKARNYLHRDKLFAGKIVENLKQSRFIKEEQDVDWSDQNISDSQLQMLFAICHPTIPVEAQIGLALRILCGFGIDEIASAFLTNKETINKRLFRAREKLREEKLEASIAYWHTIKEETKEKWESILQLYNQLLQIEYSPNAALNRTYALSKTNRNTEAIIEAEKLQLNDNQYYFTLLGVLYKDVDRAKSVIFFEKAISLARTQIEKKTIVNHLNQLE